MRTQDRSPTVSWSCPCRFHSLPLFILLVTTLVTPARSQEPPFALDPPPSTLTLCQAYEFTWTGGAPPYALSIRIPTGQIDAPVALPFTNISASRFTWTPDLIEQGIVARVFDSTGASATSAPFAVQPGSITSCVQGSTLALDQREDSGSSPPPSAARVATPGKRSFTPEAIGAIVVGAVSGALLLSALIICLWSRIRDRRRRGDFERIDLDDPFSEPNSPQGSVAHMIPWMFGRARMPTIVVTSPTEAASVFSFAMDRRSKKRLSKTPSVVLFDAIDGDDQTDGQSRQRRENEDGDNVPLLRE